MHTLDTSLPFAQKKHDTEDKMRNAFFAGGRERYDVEANQKASYHIDCNDSKIPVLRWEVPGGTEVRWFRL